MTNADPSADLTSAAAALDAAQSVLDSGVARLAEGGIDANQVLAYDVAHAAAGVMASRSLLDYGAKGPDEAAIAVAFTAEAIAELAAKVFGREAEWGVSGSELDDTRGFVSTYRSPAFLAGLADTDGARGLADDFDLRIVHVAKQCPHARARQGLIIHNQDAHQVTVRLLALSLGRQSVAAW